MLPVVAPQKAPTLIERARTEYEAFRQASTDELRHAMAYGDVAMLLKKQAPKRKWQAYIRDHVGASKTITNECIRLAKARPIIEAHLDGMPSKSIRGALKLLRSLEKGDVETPRKAKAPATDLAATMAKATPDELRAAFAASGFKKCREAFPSDWVKKLDEDFTSQMLMEKTTGTPVEPPLKNRFVKAVKSALSYVSAGNDQNDREALVALRGLNEMLRRAGCNLNDIGFTLPKSKIVPRRAA
jgi:hypothetical protein